MKRYRLAERRKAVGLSQERLAEVVGVERTTVARWEAAETNPQPWHRPRLAGALKVSIDELAELLAAVEQRAASKSRSAGGQPAHECQPDEDDQMRVPIEADPSVAAARAERSLATFLRLEAELGGDQLYEPLAAELNQLTDLVRLNAEPRLLRAYGELCQMTGWLAIDSNRHAAARRHLSTCVLASHQAEDSALAASALAYMSLDQTYRNRPTRALALAESAITVVDGDASPRVTTMLATRLARAQAKLGEHQAALRMLGVAEESLSSVADAPEPIWISYVDPVELAAQKGACYLELAMHREALDSLNDAINLLDEMKPTHARDRVHYISRVAKCQLAAGDLEQACASGHQAMDVVATLGSTRVLDRLGEFASALAAQDDASARDFRERFRTFARGR